MNATAAVKHTARRAGRFNLWAAVAILSVFAVLAVKAQTEDHSLPSRHFEARETAPLTAAPWYARKAPDFATKSHDPVH